jgi:UDP-N-acetylglucosamine 2-epimerase (non-hydrolysing)
MSKKILTILGTRPEIIRLSRILPQLDYELGSNHKILHTGQNYTESLSDIFFRDLNLRQPDIVLENKFSSLGQQLSNIFHGVESALRSFQPDAVLILGDTNSGLSSVLCERMGIPVYHMEAGNRCYDLTVPEEKNRKVIDAISSFNLPYTELSRQNLLREGISNNKIFVTGNPIKEVLNYYQPMIDRSNIRIKLQLDNKPYVISTVHRAENVDNSENLTNIIRALVKIAQDIVVVFSCHPRTRAKLTQYEDFFSTPNIRITEPMGFFDFVHLEQHTVCAITDSGTVQEEMCLFNIPTVTVRNTTERPETVWCGSNIVAGLITDQITNAFNRALKQSPVWDIPAGYERNNVSSTVVNILLGQRP